MALCSAGLGLASCAPTADVQAAPEAHHPDCSEVMLTLPEQIGGLEQRPTASQATSAWGDPLAVVLRCGVEPVMEPTELPCVAPSGVDWVWVEHEEHTQLISYGREPAVELLIENEHINESTMMDVQVALSAPVTRIDQSRECLAMNDVDPEDDEP